MQKEIIAICLLALMAAVCAANIALVRSVTKSMENDITLAYNCAISGDFKSADDAVESAQSRWERFRGYADAALRHSETDALTEALFDFAEEPDSYGEYAKLVAKLRALYEMERPRFGSIF